MRREPQGGVECRHRVEAPIEPKHKFIEICLQMTMADSMMRPKQPCFEVGEGNVNHRKVSIGSFGVTIKHQGFVRVAQFRQVIVARPAISTHDRTLRHILPDELREFLCSTAWHEAQPQSARVDHSPVLLALGAGRADANLDGSDDRRLVVDATPLARCTATHKCFVHFDRILITDSVALRSYQAGAQLVKHLERRLVAGQAQLPLKLKSRLPRRLRGHEVSAPEPHGQWRVTGLHDGGPGERHIGVAGAAPQDNRCSLGEPVGLADNSALHASEAVRPSQMFQVARARSVIGEDPLKLGKRCRKPAGIHSGKLASPKQIGKQPDRQGMNLQS